jgi:hypothetical protein
MALMTEAISSYDRSVLTIVDCVTSKNTEFFIVAGVKISTLT